MLRRLPFRVRPLPDEPFDSWVETMASAYRATMGEMMTALGLIGPNAIPEDRPNVSWAAGRWTLDLEDGQLDRLFVSTGLQPTVFQAMSRTTFASTVAQYTRKGRLSPTSPVAGTTGRYCPECLIDSGGRWRLSWNYSFVAVCPRHRRILVDTCPLCKRPPRLSSHPMRLIPNPGHCHNRKRGKDERGICGSDLREDQGRISAGNTVVAAQRALFATVATGRARFGIYQDYPQPAIAVMQDIRLLARIAMLALSKGHQIDTADIEPATIEIALNDERQRPANRPGIATFAAVGSGIAYHALHDHERAIDLLAGRLANSTVYSGYTPQVAELIAEVKGRRSRGIQRLLTRASPNPSGPSERARRLPALMWPVWTAALRPPDTRAEIAAQALSVAVVLAGTKLSHGAALALLDPTVSPGSISNVTRRLGRTADGIDRLGALQRLATLIDEGDVPIDYAQRRSLDYSDLLPDMRWRDLADKLDVMPGGPARLRHCRLVMYLWLTGSRASTAPDAFKPSGRPDHAAFRSFERDLPARISDALKSEAVEFLRCRDIDAPLTWQPPLELVEVTPDDTTQSADWPPPRPAASYVRDIVGVHKVTSAYTEGQSLRGIAAEIGVGKRTVANIVVEAGGDLRAPVATQRHRPDLRWLRQQYEVGHLTTVQIAELLECSPSTVIRRLREADVHVRPRGGASHAREAMEIDPEVWPLIARVATGPNLTERLERYLVLASSRTISQAAIPLGIAPSGLNTQMHRLEAIVGGQLFTTAKREQPLTLTVLGEQLVREARAFLAAHHETKQEHPEEER